MSYAAPLSPVSLARVRSRIPRAPRSSLPTHLPSALGPRNPFNLRAFCVASCCETPPHQGPFPDSQVSTERKRDREKELREGSRELGQRTRRELARHRRSKALPAAFPIQKDILLSSEKSEYLIVVNIYMCTRISFRKCHTACDSTAGTFRRRRY